MRLVIEPLEPGRLRATNDMGSFYPDYIAQLNQELAKLKDPNGSLYRQLVAAFREARADFAISFDQEGRFILDYTDGPYVTAAREFVKCLQRFCLLREEVNVGVIELKDIKTPTNLDQILLILPALRASDLEQVVSQANDLLARRSDR